MPYVEKLLLAAYKQQICKVGCQVDGFGAALRMPSHKTHRDLRVIILKGLSVLYDYEEFSKVQRRYAILAFIMNVLQSLAASSQSS